MKFVLSCASISRTRIVIQQSRIGESGLVAIAESMNAAKYDGMSSEHFVTRRSDLIEFGAGSVVGLLVGLITGLSISAVTSTILGALSAGLLLLLGFKEPKEGDSRQSHVLRIFGFGLFCSMALVCGIILRTYQVLSPSIQKQNERLVAVKAFTPEQITEILLSTNFGLHSESAPASPGMDGLQKRDEKKPKDMRRGSGEKPQPETGSADMAYSGLLRAGSPQFCQVMRRDQFRDVRSYLTALRRRDPGLAGVVESVPPNERDALSESLSNYLCPQ